MKDRYLTARQAADTLGVTLPSLYAYVSRGLIRSEEAGRGTRLRRYHAEDVQRLKLRKEQRRHPDAVAERALHWGDPVLESSITLIADGRFYYRSQDAIALAITRSVEQVAALIWTGNEQDSVRLFSEPPGDLPLCCKMVLPYLTDREPVALFGALLALAAAEDAAAYDVRPAAVAQTGARILRLLTTIAAGNQSARSGIAHALQQGWAPLDRHAEALISVALILCADHELNVASFAARCVASAGASPYGVVIAGLAAAQGTEHGGQTRKVAAFLRDAQAVGARQALSGWLARGEEIPGFGHPLYPEGDPRGQALLAMASDAYPHAPAVALVRAVAEEVRTLLGEFPAIDVGLVTLAWTLSLPSGSALTLFALGRTIGWIGHAIEQYQDSRLIRPRARYTGVNPDDTGRPVGTIVEHQI